MKRVFKLLVVCCLSLSLAACHAGKTIYVSTTGSAAGSGEKDDPLTFEAAVERMSIDLKLSDGVFKGGYTIEIAEGVYPVLHAVTLGDQFKGSKRSPLTIKAADGAEVIFDGSRRVPNSLFEKVSDPAERAKLAASSVDNIYVATITDDVLISQFSKSLITNLIIDGVEYLPSVFPNEGYTYFEGKTITPEVSNPGIPHGSEASGLRSGIGPFQEEGKPVGWRGSLEEPRGAEARFKQQDEMAGSWAQWESEISGNNSRNELVGFIEADWLLSSQPIYSASAAKKSVRLTRVLAYGWKLHNDSKPFRVFGLLCELDQPGEWHFDTKTNRLYIYPTTPISEESTVALAVADGFMKMSNQSSYIRVEGISVCNVGDGVIFDVDGDNNLIAGVEISRSTARGVDMSGTNNSMLSCDLFDLDSHVALRGGSRSADGVVEAGNLVENCQFYQKNYKHEKVNISMSGAGNVFRNNLVHNSIGQPMIVYGNNQLIELNEFFNVGHQEGDGGAIYSGADLAGYGNVYRHNFFHHLIHHPGKVERAGIHLDDGQSGATCYGNVFYKSAGKGLFAFGGSGHSFYDNIFLEGHRGAYFVISLGQKMLDIERIIAADPKSHHVGSKEDYVGRVEQTIGKDGWANPAWVEAYPLFNKIMSDTGVEGRLWPRYYTIKNNFSYKNKITDIADYRVSEESLSTSIVEDYIDVTPEDFVDYDNLNLEFVDKDKFVDIPFNSIGLYSDSYRVKSPNKNYYRLAIKDFYKDVSSVPGSTQGFDSSSLTGN